MIRRLRQFFKKERKFRKARSQKLDSVTYDLGDRVLVIGDSHVRSYARNANFFPVFLGQGKEHNFTSAERAENYFRQSEKVLAALSSQTVILVFGEPDCRNALGGGWLPWDGNVEFPDDAAIIEGAAPRLSASIARMKDYYYRLSASIAERKLLVAPIFPVKMREENLLIAEMNSLLEEAFGAAFLAVPEAIEGEQSYLADLVHQSNQIQPLVENELIKRSLIMGSNFRAGDDWNSASIHDAFRRNSHFGCMMFEVPGDHPVAT